MTSKILFVACLSLILLGQFANSAPAKKSKKKLREKKITLDFVWKKVRILDAKLKRAQAELESTRTRVQRLASQPMKLDAAHFDEEPECPVKIPGFYHSAMFQSCYRLEPGNVMLNWTEAVNLCKSYNPKAHLVSIESEAEMEYLKAKWFAERGIASIARFWTSGHRDGFAWRWAGSDRDITYLNWIPTTTHDDDRFQCIAVYSNEAYYWGDVACWGPHMVTCEFNL